MTSLWPHYDPAGRFPLPGQVGGTGPALWRLGGQWRDLWWAGLRPGNISPGQTARLARTPPPPPLQSPPLPPPPPPPPTLQLQPAKRWGPDGPADLTLGLLEAPPPGRQQFSEKAVSQSDSSPPAGQLTVTSLSTRRGPARDPSCPSPASRWRETSAGTWVPGNISSLCPTLAGRPVWGNRWYRLLQVGGGGGFQNKTMFWKK